MKAKQFLSCPLEPDNRLHCVILSFHKFGMTRLYSSRDTYACKVFLFFCVVVVGLHKLLKYVKCQNIGCTDLLLYATHHLQQIYLHKPNFDESRSSV